MSRPCFLHTHLLLCRKSFPLQHYPSNSLYATYSREYPIALNTIDKLVKYIGSHDHCDATALLWDDGEQSLGRAHVLPVFHHNYLTSTILPPFVNTDPRSRPDTAIPA